MKLVCALAVSTLLLASPARGATIVNGDFAAGLDGWTTFVTPTGQANATSAVFDTDGDGTSSTAARFAVGQVAFTNTAAGGGIYQAFSTAGGSFTFSADIAARNDGSLTNSAGGLFEMLVDNVTVASFDFGGIDATTTERSTLLATVNLSAGSHELRFLMTRRFLPSPTQAIDDVTVTSSNVPEPTSLTLVASAVLLGIRRRSTRT